MGSESPRTIVLASQSPRRLELARAEGWQVTVLAPPEEAEAAAAPRAATESLEAYVIRLARTKAAAVARLIPRGVILACDTLSEVDGMPLGKPRDREHARRMLETLSGRHHRVVTGVCLWNHPVDPPLVEAIESLLEMPALSGDFIDRYLATGLWEGKAGACGFQDGVIPLQLVAGSPSNVVGLPLEAVRTLLRRIPFE